MDSIRGIGGVLSKPVFELHRENVHTHIYIYIYMYVCMYVCMYICMSGLSSLFEVSRETRQTWDREER